MTNLAQQAMIAKATVMGIDKQNNKREAILIPGDGIGPSITEAVVSILDAADAPISWRRLNIGASVVDAEGDPLPQSAIDAVGEVGLALKGPVTTPVGRGFTSVNVRLRKALDLYACLRPVKLLPSFKSRYDAVDLVVVRENTQGLYAGIEHEVIPGVYESIKVVSKAACERICRFAFEYAIKHARKKVTVIHKANIMKLTDGLMLRTFEEVAADYPKIEADDCIIDAASMKLVLHPERFDVMVTGNLYGDILSDLCSGLVGGLGVTPGANLGKDCAVFEAVHGSAPDIAGKNLANPTALLLSAVLMLEHIGASKQATRIRAALNTVLAAGTRTGDLGGSATTTEFTSAIISAL